MARRDTAPIGAPCWIDLLTSDAAQARAFYSEVFGWEALEASEEYGGYFSFTKDGVLVAGAMPRQPGMEMPDAWSIYLATDDVTKTVEAATAEGGHVFIEPMAVGDLGTMAFIIDANGAPIGMWQPGTHQGFGVHTEPGAPSWFELWARDYEGAISFYRNVFRWDTHTMSDTPELRYTVLRHGDDQLAGIMDASAFLPEGVPPLWSVYFGVADTDATLATITRLGGTIVDPAQDTPYGRLATAADPTGARFKLIAGNAAMPAEGS